MDWIQCVLCFFVGFLCYLLSMKEEREVRAGEMWGNEPLTVIFNKTV